MEIIFLFCSLKFRSHSTFLFFPENHKFGSLSYFEHFLVLSLKFVTTRYFLKLQRLSISSLWSFLIYIFYLGFICSNLQVDQNGRFVINPVHVGGGSMVAKILNFRLSESLKNALSSILPSSELSLESSILHFLCKNLPEYPPGITM